MKSKKLEVVKGTGNVFRDLGHKHADADQFKAILAAEIIKALDREGLSVRGAQGRTGIAAADFSRIRNADLGRFSVRSANRSSKTRSALNALQIWPSAAPATKASSFMTAINIACPWTSPLCRRVAPRQYLPAGNAGPRG